MKDSPILVTCHHCRSRYRVPNPQSLHPGKKSTCHACGTGFITVTLPTLSTGQTMSGSEDAQHESTIYRFSFHGVGGTLFGIQIVNVFLTLLTLGIYHFWAKVRVRKYLFSQTECAGDRLAYEGIAKELFVGFLRAFFIFGIPYFLLVLTPQFFELTSLQQAITQWISGGILLFFIPIAVISTRRYRLSRTSWRGVRFSFRGRVGEFVKLYVKGVLLSVLTLGTYYPYYQTERQAYLTSHSFLGNLPFGFRGKGSALIPCFATTMFVAVLTVLIVFTLPPPIFPWGGKSSSFAVLGSLLLTLLIIGPLWVWFTARKYQYFWNQTTLGSARFRSSVTVRPLLNLQVENLFLLLGTLGFAWPWVVVRNQSFYAKHLTLEGYVDLNAIEQAYEYVNPIGEGLASFLDTGFDMD